MDVFWYSWRSTISILRRRPSHADVCLRCSPLICPLLEDWFEEFQAFCDENCLQKKQRTSNSMHQFRVEICGKPLRFWNSTISKLDNGISGEQHSLVEKLPGILRFDNLNQRVPIFASKVWIVGWKLCMVRHILIFWFVWLWLLTMLQNSTRSVKTSLNLKLFYSTFFLSSQFFRVH